MTVQEERREKERRARYIQKPLDSEYTAINLLLWSKATTSIYMRILKFTEERALGPISTPCSLLIGPGYKPS